MRTKTKANPAGSNPASRELNLKQLSALPLGADILAARLAWTRAGCFLKLTGRRKSGRCRATAAELITSASPDGAPAEFEISMLKWLKKKYNFLLEKYDWFIYRHAFHSIRRICKRDPGFAYLMELWIKEWRRQNPITLQLKRATKLFFKTQMEQLKHKENNGTRT